METRNILCGAIAAILFAGAGTAQAQGIWHKKAQAPSAQNACYAGFPQGLPRLYPGQNTKYWVDYDISFTYQSADAQDIPELAKFFTMTLNGTSEGSGLEFEQAEGVTPQLRFTITAYHNNTTPDHYSLAVQVSGPPSFSVNRGPDTASVSYFIENNAPFTYTEGGKMVADTAIIVANLFKNGWSCNSSSNSDSNSQRKP